MSGITIASSEFWPRLALLAWESDQSWFGILLESRHAEEIVLSTCLTVAIVVPCLAMIWYKLRVKEWETSLKQSMIDRGISAEEICRVLDAGTAMGRSSRCDVTKQPSRSSS